MPIVTVQLDKRSQVFPFIFEAGKYGLEYEELAGNQVELVGPDDKIGFVLNKIPAKVIHKERFKYI